MSKVKDRHSITDRWHCDTCFFSLTVCKNVKGTHPVGKWPGILRPRCFPPSDNQQQNRTPQSKLLHEASLAFHQVPLLVLADVLRLDSRRVQRPETAALSRPKNRGATDRPKMAIFVSFRER